jgi:hypothetical protein
VKIAGEIVQVIACRAGPAWASRLFKIAPGEALGTSFDTRPGSGALPMAVSSLQASTAVATPGATLAKQSESVWPGIVLLSLSGASGFWLARGTWCHHIAEFVFNGLGVVYFLGAILLMICSCAPRGMIELSDNRTRLINVPQGFRSTAQSVDVSRIRSLEFTEIVDVEGASRHSISLVLDDGSRLELHTGNGNHAKKQVARIGDWLQSQLEPASLPSVWRVVG